MIFELTADGKSAAYISKLLFDKNIPTPAQYKGIKGIAALVFQTVNI